MPCFLLFFLVLGLATPGLAAKSVSHAANGTVTKKLDDPRDLARKSPVIPAARASEIAVARVPGTILGMEIETNDGIRTWQVDVAANAGGTMRLWLKASTGEFLRMVRR